METRRHGRRSSKPTDKQNKTTFGLKWPRKGSTPAHLRSTWNTKKVSSSYPKIVSADGTNIDNWTIDEIKEVVAEFVADASRVSHHEPAEEHKGEVLEPQEMEEGFEHLITNKAALDETLPKVNTRSRAPTAKLIPTKLNNKRVSLKVSDSQVKKGGFFSSDYILYKIETQPLGWATFRRDNEFYTLRVQLRNQFPHILVPPLPAITKKMTRKALDKREK